MRKLIEIAYSGVGCILLYPLRSGVTIACVVVMLVPFLVGLGISKGIEHQAKDSIRFGADLYVTGAQFGRSVPVPLAAAPRIEQIEGVTRVAPRIVGRVRLGKRREEAVLVGIDPTEMADAITCVRGRLYGSKPNEVVIGTELARRLNLDVGSRIPPFYQSSSGGRVSTVVGIFKSDVSLWQANLILTSLETAQRVFDQNHLATDLLVWCRSGYQQNISREIRVRVHEGSHSEESLGLRVTAREELAAVIPAGLLYREGIFNLHFVLLFCLGIPLILITSGAGLSDRRREVGILKATGWQVDEILIRSLAESLCLSLLSAAISVLLSYLWLRVFNGFWIASVMLPGIDTAATFRVPFRLTPVPVLLSTVIALVVVMSGMLLSSWRAAVAPPHEAMR